jgi:hypothetical protein
MATIRKPLPLRLLQITIQPLYNYDATFLKVFQSMSPSFQPMILSQIAIFLEFLLSAFRLFCLNE